jgi:hypothetical protein
MAKNQKLFVRVSNDLASELSSEHDHTAGQVVEGFSIDDHGLREALEKLDAGSHFLETFPIKMTMSTK